MSVALGLMLFGLVGYFIYCLSRFTWTVIRHRQNNTYSRRMIYSLVAALLMIAAIVWL